MKRLNLKMDPLPQCPLCGRLLTRDRVTRLMRRKLRPKSRDKGTITAWRGMFCQHRVAMVTVAYRLLDQDHWMEPRP